MATRKQFDMKIPVRAAPPPPIASYQKQQTSRKDDLFANDPFNGNNHIQKKKPPPRPPPPKLSSTTANNKPSVPLKPKPDVPQRPAHFNRKPTILSNLINRGKPKYSSSIPASSEFQSHVILPPPTSGNHNDVGNLTSLIDFNSPPSSPTLTTRSSSDGLSVDSFGSDITSSTGNGNTPINGGNTSQAESGFEDDFDIFSSKSGTDRDTPQDSWAGLDPFSPPQNSQKNKVNRPIYDSDFLDPLCNGKTVKPSVQIHKLPTIIRAKPARPKTPKNSALLSNSLISAKVPQSNNGLSNYSTIQEQDYFVEDGKLFESGDYSPPMPNIPPPPPPPNVESSEPAEWSNDIVQDTSGIPHIDYNSTSIHEEPYGIALFDFPGSHEDDLPFRINDKIRLLRKLNDEWMYGKLRCGIEGMFPIEYIQIQVPLSDEESKSAPLNQKTNSMSYVQPTVYVTAMYDFVPQQDGDLGFCIGDQIKVLSKCSDEWLYGEIGINRGQFPANYVDHVPLGLPMRT